MLNCRIEDVFWCKYLRRMLMQSALRKNLRYQELEGGKDAQTHFCRHKSRVSVLCRNLGTLQRDRENNYLLSDDGVPKLRVGVCRNRKLKEGMAIFAAFSQTNPEKIT